MTPYALWLTEFLLSLVGARLALRRKLPLVALFLGFRACADLICFLALLHSYRAYNYADYFQRVIQYALFGVLAIWASAQVLRENKSTAKFYGGGSLLAWTLAVIYFHWAVPLNGGNLLRFESFAHLLAGAFLAYAMYAGNAFEPWRGIAHGMLALACSDALLAIAQSLRWQVEAWYPLGAIAGLALMVWALQESASYPEPVRLGLGVR